MEHHRYSCSTLCIGMLISLCVISRLQATQARQLHVSGGGHQQLEAVAVETSPAAARELSFFRTTETDPVGAQTMLNFTVYTNYIM